MAHAAASATEYLPYARQKYMTYFCTNGSVANHNSTLSENLILSGAFELEKIRLRLSVVHVSLVDFMVYISHHKGLMYNQNLVSQAMLGVKDVMYQADPTLRLHESDVIHFSMVYSAANIYGLEVSGWAITVPTGG